MIFGGYTAVVGVRVTKVVAASWREEEEKMKERIGVSVGVQVRMLRH